MAALPQASIDKVWKDFMSKYSSLRSEIPVSKHQVRAFAVIVDGEMETAEASIVQSVPAGEIRDWLISNDEVGRDMVTMIEKERREVL